MELLSILFWYALPLTVYLSAYITMRRGLKRYSPTPAYAPPGWMIAFIWLVLYMLQGSAAWLLMQHNNSTWTYQLTMYCVFLGLSLFYGPIFSKGKHRLTFFYTLLLLSYSAVVDGFFFKKYAWSGWILLPTVIWLVFATWLSFATYQNYMYRSVERIDDDYDNEEEEEEQVVQVVQVARVTKRPSFMTYL